MATPATKPAKPPKPFKRKKGERPDWDALEPHYRANKQSLREIGLMFDVTAAGILKHARLQTPPWARDLSAEIDARAEQLVNEAAVNAKVNEPRPVSHALVVQANADMIATVRLGQRERFGRVATLATEMFVALHQQFTERETLDTLGELMAQVTESGSPTALTKMYSDVIALPGQIKALKDLTDIIGKLTDMERVAFKLEKAPEGGENSRTSLPVRFVETKWVERVEPGEEDE